MKTLSILAGGERKVKFTPLGEICPWAATQNN